MCRSKAQGGLRCAAHAVQQLVAARTAKRSADQALSQALGAGAPPADLAAKEQAASAAADRLMSASVEYAATNEGRTRFEQAAQKADAAGDFDGAADTRRLLAKGIARRAEADRAFEQWKKARADTDRDVCPTCGGGAGDEHECGKLDVQPQRTPGVHVLATHPNGAPAVVENYDDSGRLADGGTHAARTVLREDGSVQAMIHTPVSVGAGRNIGTGTNCPACGQFMGYEHDCPVAGGRVKVVAWHPNGAPGMITHSVDGQWADGAGGSPAQLILDPDGNVTAEFTAESMRQVEAEMAADADAASTDDAAAVDGQATVDGMTAAEHKTAAAAAHQDAWDSFGRSDTDGFATQAASGLSAQLHQAKADIAAAGGTAEFPALFDRSGNPVPAKLVRTRYGTSWALLESDDPDSSITGWFSPSKAQDEDRRRATDAKKGFYVGAVRAPANARYSGGGKGFAGMATVSVQTYRTDGGFSRGVQVVDNGQGAAKPPQPAKAVTVPSAADAAEAQLNLADQAADSKGASARCPACGQFTGARHDCPAAGGPVRVAGWDGDGNPTGHQVLSAGQWTTLDAEPPAAEAAAPAAAPVSFADVKGADRVEAMRAEIEKAVSQMGTAEGWRRFLENRSTFHTYSLSNQLLIAIQRPGATRVAGLKAWARDHERTVRKGEKAIWVYAPMIRRRKDTDPDTGEEKVSQQVTGFRPVPVFDVAQTEGKPLPAPPSVMQHADGQAPSGMKDQITAAIGSLGYKVEYADTGKADGYTDSSTKTVTVSAALSDLEQAKTLAHEAAHITLGHVDRTDYHMGHDGHRDDMEVEAESVGYIVSRHYGMSEQDAGKSTFGYVDSWAHGDVEKIRKTGEAVSKGARALIDMLAGDERAA